MVSWFYGANFIDNNLRHYFELREDINEKRYDWVLDTTNNEGQYLLNDKLRLEALRGMINECQQIPPDKEADCNYRVIEKGFIQEDLRPLLFETYGFKSKEQLQDYVMNYERNRAITHIAQYDKPQKGMSTEYIDHTKLGKHTMYEDRTTHPNTSPRVISSGDFVW